MLSSIVIGKQEYIINGPFCFIKRCLADKSLLYSRFFNQLIDVIIGYTY